MMVPVSKLKLKKKYHYKVIFSTDFLLFKKIKLNSFKKNNNFFGVLTLKIYKM